MSRLISTSYAALPDGRVQLAVATAEQGLLFTVALSRDEAVDNLTALARVLGLVVSRPL